MLQLIASVIVIINNISLQCSLPGLLLCYDGEDSAVSPSGLYKSQKWMLHMASESQSKYVSGPSLYKLNEQQAIKAISITCAFLAMYNCGALFHLHHMLSLQIS